MKKTSRGHGLVGKATAKLPAPAPAPPAAPSTSSTAFFAPGAAGQLAKQLASKYRAQGVPVMIVQERSGNYQPIHKAFRPGSGLSTEPILMEGHPSDVWGGRLLMTENEVELRKRAGAAPSIKPPTAEERGKKKRQAGPKEPRYRCTPQTRQSIDAIILEIQEQRRSERRLPEAAQEAGDEPTTTSTGPSAATESTEDVGSARAKGAGQRHSKGQQSTTASPAAATLQASSQPVPGCADVAAHDLAVVHSHSKRSKRSPAPEGSPLLRSRSPASLAAPATAPQRVPAATAPTRAPEASGERKRQPQQQPAVEQQVRPRRDRKQASFYEAGAAPNPVLLAMLERQKKASL